MSPPALSPRSWPAVLITSAWRPSTPAQAQGAALAALAALPAAGSPEAALLVQQLQQQVAALSSTLSVAASTSSDASAPTAQGERRRAPPQQQQHVTAEHFRQLARAAVPAPGVLPDVGGASLAGQGGVAAGPGTGGVWPAVPGDAAAALAAAREAVGGARRRRDAWVSRQLLQRLGSCAASARFAGGEAAAAGRGALPEDRQGEGGPELAAHLDDETSRCVFAFVCGGWLDGTTGPPGPSCLR